MSCGIYKITNQVNGKVYIGQSSNIENRWREHILTANNKDYYGHTRMLIYPAIRKYGIENFSISIIEECSIEQLDEREIYWISYYDATNPIKGYNLLSGGQSGRQFNPEDFYTLWDSGKTIGEIHEITNASYATIEHNLRTYTNYSTSESMSRSMQKIDNDGMFEKVAVYQYDLLGNYITSYESIADASRALFGDNKHTSIQSALNNQRNPIAYNYLWSREKVDQLPMYRHGKQKPVQCIDTGEIFVSTRAAARAYSMKSPSSIIACCQGRQHTAAKDLITHKPLHWKYYE